MFGLAASLLVTFLFFSCVLYYTHCGTHCLMRRNNQLQCKTEAKYFFLIFFLSCLNIRFFRSMRYSVNQLKFNGKKCFRFKNYYNFVFLHTFKNHLTPFFFVFSTFNKNQNKETKKNLFPINTHDCIYYTHEMFVC